MVLGWGLLIDAGWGLSTRRPRPDEKPGTPSPIPQPSERERGAGD